VDGGSIEAVVAEARAEVAALADKIRDWELTRIWERKPLVSVRVACGIDLPRCFRDHLGCAGQGRYGTGSERFPCWATAEGTSQVSDRASNGFARRLPQVLAQSSHRSQEIATVAIVGTTDSPAPHHTCWAACDFSRVAAGAIVSSIFVNIELQPGQRSDPGLLSIPAKWRPGIRCCCFRLWVASLLLQCWLHTCKLPVPPSRVTKATTARTCGMARRPPTRTLSRMVTT